VGEALGVGDTVTRVGTGDGVPVGVAVAVGRGEMAWGVTRAVLVGPGVGVPPTGMINRWPTQMKSRSAMSLASMRATTVVPNRRAILIRLSPRRTM